MKDIILEEAERQNWVTKLKIYTSGISTIENINQSTKKVSKVYLNIKTTNIISDRLLKEKVYNVSPANRITSVLTRLGIVKMKVEETMKDK